MESTTDSQILFNSDDDQYDSISSGKRLVYNYTQKFNIIVKETNDLLKDLKIGMRCSLECLVRQNSISTHDKFDEKMRNDFVKNPKYMEKMQTRFDEAIHTTR